MADSPKTQVTTRREYPDGKVEVEKDYRTQAQRKEQESKAMNYENAKVNLSTVVSALAFVGMAFGGFYVNAVDKDIEEVVVVTKQNADAIKDNTVAISENASALTLMIQVQQQQSATLQGAAEDASDNKEALIYLKAQAEAEARRRAGN